MSRRRFFTSTFNKSLNEDAPENILPLPFLTEIKNLVREKQGSLVSRKRFDDVNTLPLNDEPDISNEKPLRLFKINEHLFCITSRRVFSYNATQREWSRLFVRRDMGLKLISVTQKEKDLSNLCLLYTSPSPRD